MEWTPSGVRHVTRMWGIDPKYLCDTHLVAEHAEMHQAVGTIQRHPHGKAIMAGHAEHGQIDTSKIRERHDTLARELERRGMTHSSPLEYEDELGLGFIDPASNLALLKRRCAACRRRLENAGDTA